MRLLHYRLLRQQFPPTGLVSYGDTNAPMILTSGFLRAFRFFLADGLRSSVLATDDDLTDSTDRGSPLPAVEADFLGRPT